MCRFLAYRGRPVLMDELLYQPRNSLIKQSVSAHESEEPLNGDGFGVGWYSHSLNSDPGLFVSVRPAWNDRNLSYIARKIKSDCIFAHVRAASLGEVSEANCHPFHFKNFLFMHNGGVEDFHLIKRFLRRELSDEIYDWVRGQTDSEHIFALFLEFLLAKKGRVTAEIMSEALEDTIEFIAAVKKKHGLVSDDYMNIAVTDGRRVVAVRYCSSLKEKAPTLYFAHGAKFECKEGTVTMTQADQSEHAVLIVSEKLSSDRKQWKEIPRDHFLIVEDDLSISIRAVRKRKVSKTSKKKKKSA